MNILVVTWNVVEGFFALIGCAAVACGIACALLDKATGLGPKETVEPSNNVVK